MSINTLDLNFETNTDVLAFPYISINQGGEIRYLLSMKFSELLAVISFEDYNLPVSERGNRRINNSQFFSIEQYLLQTPQHILTPIVLSIPQNNIRIGSHQMEFLPNSQVKIIDGQHRILGIRKAFEKNQVDEQIGVYLLVGTDLPRRQQFFSDINAHSLKVNRTLARYYNQRDRHVAQVINVIHKIPLIERLTDLENDSPNKSLGYIWSFDKVYHIFRNIFKRLQFEGIKGQSHLIIEFFNQLISRNICGAELIGLDPWYTLINEKSPTNTEFVKQHLKSSLYFHFDFLFALGKLAEEEIPSNYRKSDKYQWFDKLYDLDLKLDNPELSRYGILQYKDNLPVYKSSETSRFLLLKYLSEQLDIYIDDFHQNDLFA